MKSEIEIIRECRNVLDILRCHKLLEYKKIHVTYGDRPSDIQKSIEMAGLPDMQLYLRKGVTLNIEFKSEKGKQRECQAEWQQQLELLNHHYYIVRSVDDLSAILLKHGIDKSKHTWQNAPIN